MLSRDHSRDKGGLSSAVSTGYTLEGIIEFLSTNKTALIAKQEIFEQEKDRFGVFSLNGFLFNG